MKYEVTCHDNPSCPSNIVVGKIGDDVEMFRHVMLSSNRDRCPCCGVTGVRTTRIVADTHRFAMGTIAVTPLADEALGNDNEAMRRLIERHVVGDWGKVIDPEVNEESIGDDRRPTSRRRLVSIYEYAGTTVWIITEAGRHSTTILLPEEY